MKNIKHTLHKESNKKNKREHTHWNRTVVALEDRATQTHQMSLGYLQTCSTGE
jgi:hypothetical protein